MRKDASKEKRISDIVLMLEEGKETKDILRKLSESCGKSKRTFEDEIKTAKDIVFKRNEEKEAIRQATMSVEYAEAVKEAIISDVEIEAILCKLVTGNMEVLDMIQGVPTLRGITPTEIIQAAKTLYTKRGSNAAAKIDHTTLGEKINQQTITLPNGAQINIS